MEEFDFQVIPEKYKHFLNDISDKVIKNLYSNFEFFYLHPSSINLREKHEDTKGEDFLQHIIYSFLKKFKFITYYVLDQIKKRKSFSANSANIENNDKKIYPQLINVVICVEKKCLIIEQIDFSLINEIIQNLKNQDFSIINVSKNAICESSIIEKETQEQIMNFCDNYDKEIKNNEFIRNTIFPLVGYLIRRYYYPTSYFKDPSFFVFNQSIESTEMNYKQKLQNFFFNDDKNSLLYDIQSVEDIVSYEYNQYKFKESDFIVLSTIYQNENYFFYLVIHTASFHIFLMKKIFSNEKNKHIEREIEFCKYSHRCLTRFYGFVTTKNEIIGIVYEYMTNGTLDSFVIGNPKKINYLFLLMTINRISQGIDYLHSNHLIHRDIKPQNILLDHDFIPYISDFETIRHPISNKQDFSNENFTMDIGSVFSSPEQYKGQFISYPSDIYSFGLIVYFLYERLCPFSYGKFEVLPIMMNGSKGIHNLYESCTKSSPKKKTKN